MNDCFNFACPAHEAKCPCVACQNRTLSEFSITSNRTLTEQEISAILAKPPKEEVRHGRWEWDRRIESYRCSSCRKHNADRTDFCPNCGAVMDGGQDDV